MVSPTATCEEKREDGSPCGAPPLRGETRCFWHSPSTEAEAAEARRLGGLRRRRERTVSEAYDIEGLENVAQIRRLVKIAVLDTLGLENSIARARALISGAQTAAKLLEVGEFEERLRALEQAMQPRRSLKPSGKRR